MGQRQGKRALIGHETSTPFTCCPVLSCPVVSKGPQWDCAVNKVSQCPRSYKSSALGTPNPLPIIPWSHGTPRPSQVSPDQQEMTQSRMLQVGQHPGAGLGRIKGMKN